MLVCPHLEEVGVVVGLRLVINVDVPQFTVVEVVVL